MNYYIIKWQLKPKEQNETKTKFSSNFFDQINALMPLGKIWAAAAAAEAAAERQRK